MSNTIQKLFVTGLLAAATLPLTAMAAALEPNKGDTTWMLICTALVMLMTLPGLALFYGGLTRSKNVLSVLVQCMVVFSLIIVLWSIYGYSLAFTEGNAFIGKFDRLFLKSSHLNRSPLLLVKVSLFLNSSSWRFKVSSLRLPAV